MTTKGRYGLRAMVELARYYEKEEFISLKSISQKQGIPENYLERLLAKLRKASLVETHRGTQGGYRISRSPEEINVYDILFAVGEAIYLVECTNNKSLCHMQDYCPSNVVWSKMAQQIEDVAKKTYLDELI